MTDLDVYQPPAQPEQYHARMAMTPEQAKALDEQVRLCTRAVLRDGTDYGTIPGAGDRKLLLKPGAEKLLQWFGFGFTCDRTDLEVSDDGEKQGVTYRCTVTRRLPDGQAVIVTTCEGYAGYDELKFYKPVTDAERHKAEARERGWAAKDHRPADPTKWKNLQPYKAPWNTLLKMAQKRAIVGAAIVATAASGLFGTEEDETSPVADDGSTWYEQALEAAFTFTTKEAGDEIYVGAFDAYRNGLCSGRQKDHVQNRVRRRQQQLRTARPAEAEDLAQAAEAAHDAAEGSQETAAAPEDPPGSDRHQKLVGAVQGHMKRLGFAVDDSDREQRMGILATLGGLYSGTDALASTSDLDPGELAAAADKLARCRDRKALDALIATAGNGDGDG